MSQAGFNSNKPNGPVVNPNQPAFSANLSTNQTNVTGDGTVYNIICDTVIFDQKSNYNNSTGVFTAPVTGKYLFVAGAFLTNMNTQTSMTLFINATTSTFIAKNGFQAGNGGEGCYFSGIVSMTAGDTCYISTMSSGGGGGKVNTLTAFASPGQIATYFQGYLVF